MLAEADKGSLHRDGFNASLSMGYVPGNYKRLPRVRQMPLPLTLCLSGRTVAFLQVLSVCILPVIMMKTAGTRQTMLLCRAPNMRHLPYLRKPCVKQPAVDIQRPGGAGAGQHQFFL